MINLKKFTFFSMLAVFISCNEKKEDNSFAVKGRIEGVTDQKVTLEQLFFTQQPPEIIDTAVLENGEFNLEGTKKEEGMFRITLENPKTSYIFINDASDIRFAADVRKSGIESADFKTKANSLLKNFLLYIQKESSNAAEMNAKIENLKTTKNNDSAVAAEDRRLQELFTSYKEHVVQFIDTVSDPVVAMFALGYTQGVEESRLKPVISKLATRFPGHNGVIALVNEYNKIITAEPKPSEPVTGSKGPAIGSLAPELTMNDVNGKPYSLSNLRGKYVLIDFWASWCGPCRRENPNVVKAYNIFKNKNFTVLGVSLDKDKQKWLDAIKDDNLTWQHISDLQYWNSAAVPLYGFDGIPFNVLIDPAGKVIAKDLREEQLLQTLGSVLK